MKLYIQRHAEAVNPSGWPGPDASRPLTPKGVATLEKSLAEMARVNFSTACIIASPYLRAKTTAEIIAKSLPSAEFHVLNELSSGARNDELKNAVNLFKAKESVLLVGHMPEVALFTGRLLDSPQIMQDKVDPGEMFAVEFEGEGITWMKGKLLWRRRLEDWKKAS